MVLGLPQSASAQTLWEEDYREFSATDALITAGFSGLALTAEMYGGPLIPRWTREVLFDLPVRRVLGSQRFGGERRAALVSDATVTALMAAPFIDAAATYSVTRDGTFSTQYALYSLQSFALTFGTTNVVKVLVGRSRPRVADCFERDASEPAAEHCAPRPNVSFFSGHSSVAFTGAGLVCAFGNIAPQRYGGGFAAQIPCIGGLTLAATTAVLRIVANKHHLTDVAVGTAVGLLSGWVLPAIRVR